jgi:DNA polymerase-3 subunit alpha
VGLATPQELCLQAVRGGYQSLALTDTNGTYGYVEFHLAARKYGVKPIYGAVIYHTSLLAPGRERFTLTLLAADHEGLRNVAALTSLSATAFESGVALSLDELRHRSEGVIALSGGIHGEVPARALENDDDGARQALALLKDIYDDRLYVEIQDHGDKDEKTLAQRLLVLAEQSGVPPVLTQGIRYTRPEMHRAYGLLAGVRHPHEETDFFKIETYETERSMRPQAEMQRLFSVYPEAYRNAHRIDERIPDDLFARIDDPGALLDRLGNSRQSLIERCLGELHRRYPEASDDRTGREAIVHAEVSEITRAGLVGTFLLYHGLISRLRKAGVALGPATGVNLQSLCAHLLGITSYDPYAYSDDFHPMFQPRIESLSELEIQVTSESREKAVDVLREAVGERRFAYVPAIERITAARAVRMVAGVVEIAEKDLEEVLKIIGRHPGSSIQALIEEDRELGRMYNRLPPVREVLTRAALLEGLPCGFIKSRRSVAFSAAPLTDYLAESIDAETGDRFIHAGRDVLPVEPFLRIDFTPLSALSVVERADDDLDRDHIAAWVGFSKNDPLVWREVQAGDTTGIFLFDGKILQQQRDVFELRSLDHLTNLLALLRFRDDEGTLVERIKAFHRGEIFSSSDRADVFRILRRTRGRILYDEQVRDLLSVLTGADPVEALNMLYDARAIDPATLSRVRGRFMRAMADQDVPMESANTWFERVLFHAKQTVRRERVLADAILVYRMFYLKAYYPAIFYKALLNSHLGNDTRLKKYIGHLEERGMLLPLDINRSDYLFEREEGKVRAGFCVIPGMDALEAGRIIKARGKGGFRSADDFAHKARARGITSEAVRKLVEAGAFDAMGERDDLRLAQEEPPRRRAASKRRGEAGAGGQLEIPFDGEA